MRVSGWKSLLTLCVLFVFVVGALGCSVVKKPRRLFGGVVTMSVATVPDFNNNTPLAVELLVFYDQKLLDKVKALSAQDWFDQRAQFLKDYPTDDGDYDQWKWEWIPGQNVPDEKMVYQPRVKGWVLFASYFSAGDHRQLLTPGRAFQLNLGANGFTIEDSP